MSKEAYIEAHEELMAEKLEEWCEAHPNHTPEEYAEAEARIYNSTADAAYGRMTDTMADRADHYRQLKKDGML